MDLLLWPGIFIVSLAFLVKASDWFVNGAETIGIALGIPPFIVGVTIVAVGTSLPELASSISAVFAGSTDIVAGNAIGSNITNIVLVMGLVAIFSKQKIEIKRDIMDVDIPMLVASALLLWFLIADLNFTMLDAAMLIAGMFIFLAYTFTKSGDDEEEITRQKIGWQTIALVIGSGALIYFSANYTVMAIQEISDLLGIGTGVIALSLVALGTSLPEVLVSVTAARKGNTEIAFGNVIGSNIFNTFAVMGIPRFLGPIEIPASIIEFSLPMMVGITIFFAIICLSRRISRFEGMFLLLFYLVFMIGLFSNI
ncbi:MAG: calcium/sodium antiporter [Saprospiraceae bacterium]